MLVFNLNFWRRSLHFKNHSHMRRTLLVPWNEQTMWEDLEILLRPRLKSLLKQRELKTLVTFQ